ncbi:MAG: DNA methyltransferase [Vampirovibrionales bacterium]
MTQQPPHSGHESAQAASPYLEALPSPPASPKILSKRRFNTTLPYNDMDLAHWRDYNTVETDSLWLWDQREKANGHSNEYHGNCVPQILTQLLTRYTKAGETVLDLFLGSGTSAIEAANLGRQLVGVEIQSAMVNAVHTKLQAQQKTGPIRIVNGDSSHPQATQPLIQNALGELGTEQADFLFLHPPYADIIRFSDLEGDLSNANDVDAFLDGFERVAQLGFDNLKPGRFAALVIGDKYAQGEWIPLGFYCLQRLNAVGFKTKSIVVKNMAGNERAKGKQANLWRYRALKGGFYVFKHEYVMIVQKAP